MTGNPSAFGARRLPLWWMVVRPRRGAAALQADPRWVILFLLLVIGHVIITSLLLDASIRATMDRIPASATATERVEIVSVLHQEHYARSLLLPLRLGAGWAIFALWVFGLVRSFFPRGAVRFPQVLSLVIHTEVLGLLSRLSVVLRCRLFPSEDPVNDLAPPLGLASVFPYLSDHTLWFSIRSVDIFAIWALCVLSVGIAEFCRVSLIRASALAVFVWASATFGNILLVALITSALHLNL